MFWRKEVPFGGLIDFWKKLGAWGPKNPKIFAVQCAQHERSTRFSLLMAQNACFDIGKCPLGSDWLLKKIGGVGAQKPQNFRHTMRSARTEQPIFTINGSKCVFRRNEALFVHLIDFLKNWGCEAQIPQHFRLTRRTARTEQPIFIVKGSNACSDVRKCPLCVWLTFEKTWGRGGPKTPTFSPDNAHSLNGATDFHP